MPESYHRPVMLKECMEGLAILPDGVYIDATFGGGGHSSEILKELKEGHLYAFDQDPDAKENALAFTTNFTFIGSNFRYLQRYMKMYNVIKVDGILADLGVSSHQIDAGHRGFSTRFNGALDMRMSQAGENSAKSLVNTYKEGDLQKVFSQYGEIKNAKTLARTIVSYRGNSPIETTEQLIAAAETVAPRRKEHKYFAQIFQSIRIAVNDEITALEEFLVQAIDLLKPEGRLVVMSYHSLEDRLVKHIYRYGNFSGNAEKDFYGNLLRPLDPVNRKPITAGEMELKENPRSRSAKLRIAKKI